MRLLVATGLYPPDIGGPATYTKILEDELPQHDIEVVVVPLGLVRKLPKVVRHTVYFFLVLKRGFKANVIYALDPVSVGLPALLAAKILRKRFLVRIAGDYAWEQGVQRFNVKDSLDVFAKTRGKYAFMVLLFRGVQNFVAQGGDMVIVPSKYLKRIVTDWGITKNNITVIYNSFDPPQKMAHKKILRELLQFKGELILSSGRLVPWKGFMTLVSLMPDIVKDFPDAKLVIVGDGPDRGKIVKHITKCNMEDHVVLTGVLPHDTLLRYIKAADLFVLNTFYEGFSHLLLESMALGVPVVTTSVGGNPEIVTHKKNGLLVSYDDKGELKDSMITLLKDKKLRTSLAHAGESTAHIFTQEKMINELKKILMP